MRSHVPGAGDSPKMHDAFRNDMSLMQLFEKPIEMLPLPWVECIGVSIYAAALLAGHHRDHILSLLVKAVRQCRSKADLILQNEPARMSRRVSTEGRRFGHNSVFPRGNIEPTRHVSVLERFQPLFALNFSL